MQRLMRLSMARAISHDSSSNPSTPGSDIGSAPSTAEILAQDQRHNLWREHKHQSMEDNTTEAPCGKRLRSANSDSDISHAGIDDIIEVARKDVKCTLVKTLHPKTKFDSQEAIITGLIFKSNGDLVVSDSGNHKVKSVDAMTGQLRIECSVGSEQATLAKPSGVTVLKSEQILVVDKDKADLKLFTKEGRFLAKFGRDLEAPHGITSLANGNVVVSDLGSGKIFLYQNLSEKGVVDLTKDVENGGSLKLGQPFGVSATNDGAKFSISDSKNNTVLLADGHGKLLNNYYQAKSDNSPGAIVQPGLVNPRGISQELHANTLLIADTGNSRIVRLDLDTMTLTREVLSVEGQGQGQGQISDPELVAAGPKGLMAVVDKDRSHVKVYKYME